MVHSLMRRLRFIGWLLLSILLLASPGWAEIVCVNEASVGRQPPLDDPHTLAFTPDVGSNRIVIVAIGYNDADADNTTITSVTSSAGGTWSEYGFVNEEAGSSDLVSAIYYSTDFADGAQTISVTRSSPVTWGTIAIYSCTGVRTSNPWRGANSENTANSAASVSTTVASAVGDLVVDTLTATALGAGEAPTVDGSQTQMYNVTSLNDNGDMSGSTEAGVAGNVTMSWTSAGSDRYALVAGSLVPASDSGGARRRHR